MSGDTGSYGEFKTGWPVVLSAMLGIGLGLSPLPFYTIGILAPHLHEAFHWALGEIFIGVTVSTVVTISLSPFVGMLADKIGVRRVALASVALFGLSFMGFALMNGNIWLFYLNWALVSIFGAGTLPLTWTRAVNNRFDRRKGLALGLSLLGTGLFGYLSPTYTTWAVAHYGWRGAYLLIGALPLVIAFPIAFFCFHDVGPARQTGAERKLLNAARREATPGLTAGQAFLNWRFWIIGVAFLPIAFTAGGVIPNLTNILKLSGFKPADAVGLVSMVGLSVIAGRTIGGWLFDRFWAPAVSLFLLGIPASACWILAHGPFGYLPTGVAVFFVGFAAGVEYDLLAFLVARYFGLKSYGLIYGGLYSFFALGAGVGSPIFGAFYDKTHSYVQPLTISSLFMALGVLLLLTLGGYRRFAQPDGADIIAAAESGGDALPV